MAPEAMPEMLLNIQMHPWKPEPDPLGPWVVTISSEQKLFRLHDQVCDLTEVRGMIEVPNLAVAEEFARRLRGSDGA